MTLSQDDAAFFHFTAIPDRGCHTVRPGASVWFEVVENEADLTARNIQKEGES
jgi:cold shock CspA family protein